MSNIAMTKEIIICSRCGGTGKLQQRPSLHRISLYDSEWVTPPMQTCDVCGGTGRLLKVSNYVPLSRVDVYFDLEHNEVNHVSEKNSKEG